MKYAQALFTGASMLFLFQPAVHAEWFVETVDAAEPAGYACSLVLDASGTPHVSYWRSSPAPFAQFLDLYYARKSGATWLTEEANAIDTMSFGENTSIVIGESGRPAIAFQTNGTVLKFIQRNAAGEWPAPSEVNNNNGNFLSLIWDDINTPATPQPKIIASQGTNLNFFTPNGANWNMGTSDSTNAGNSCSMALSSTGEIGVAYLKGGNVRFASSIAGGTPAPPDALVFPQNRTATRTAFAWDSNNRAHIFYYDQINNRYCHLTNAPSGVWPASAAPVDVVTTTGTKAIDPFGCSIAAGTDGSLHIAFIDYATNTLKYGRKAAGASSWVFETVDAQGSTGGSCQIRLDSLNRPKIAFQDITDASMKFAQRLSPLSFTVDGKKKRKTTKRSLVLKGRASDSATVLEWRVGKKAFRSVALPASGQWSVTARGFKPGKNKVQFRARGVDGSLTTVQTIRVIRG